MGAVRMNLGDTERIEVLILDGTLTPITGKSDILLSIRRVRDDKWFDFDSGELDFKDSGWVARQVAMAEVDSTNDPGCYFYDFNTSVISDSTSGDIFMVRVDQDPGTDAANVPQTGEIRADLQTDEIDAIKERTDNLPDDPADQSQVEAAISTSESNIRGGSDTLDSLSDQLDTVQADLDDPDQYKADVSGLATGADSTNILDAIADVQADLDNPDQFKADVSALAIEANVEGHVTNSLNTYDPPTKAELDAAEANIRGGSDTLDSLSGQLDVVQADLDDPDQYKADVSGLATGSDSTNILDAIADVQADLDNPDQFKADVSALALEANVEGHVTDALNTYDPPTKAEIDTLESNIRGGTDTLDSLSGQLDVVQADLTAILDILGLLKDYHDNTVKFFGSNGSTEVTQSNAYFMTVFADDGVTPLKRIEFKDSGGNPAKLSEATRYVKT